MVQLFIRDIAAATPSANTSRSHLLNIVRTMFKPVESVLERVLSLPVELQDSASTILSQSFLKSVFLPAISGLVAQVKNASPELLEF